MNRGFGNEEENSGNNANNEGNGSNNNEKGKKEIEIIRRNNNRNRNNENENNNNELNETSSANDNKIADVILALFQIQATLRVSHFLSEKKSDTKHLISF